MHHYAFHINDYRSDTAHLSNEEDLCFRRLLDMYYDTEDPIPLETDWVARRLRVGSDVVVNVLADYFIRTESGWVNARCDEEIARYHAKAEQARTNGKLGGRKKKTKREPNGNRIGTEVPPGSQANQEPITNNQLTVPKGTDADASKPLTPDEIIFGYGVPLLTNSGSSEKQARSFLGGLRKAHGDTAVIDKLRDCLRAKPLQPIEWLAAALPPAGRGGGGKQSAVEARNARVVADWVPPEMRGDA